MPIYEYRCQTCGEQFDKLFRSLQQAAKAQVRCPACQSAKAQRLVSAVAVHSGQKAGAAAEAQEPTPAKPPVFGRKELKQALEQKKQLRQSALDD